MRHSSREFPVDTVKKVNKNVASPREEEQEKGIEVHRHKRWNLLNQYDSLYDYVKSTM